MGQITIEEIKAALPTDFTIEGLLDQGGQGAVFKGKKCGDTIALKIIDPGTTEDKRIVREINFLKSVSHPNIVKLLDHHQIAIRGIPVQMLAYEFIEHGDLSARIGVGTACSADELVAIAKCIGTAIDIMWNSRERVVHRDIKPKNIMLRAPGQYVLVDFGLARHVDLSDMTAIGSPGTNGFRSPEQAKGRKELTFKSDIFSLGVTLSHLATGRHPYGGLQPTPEMKITNSVVDLRADLDPKISNLILTMLRPSPADRPANLVAQLEILEL